MSRQKCIIWCIFPMDFIGFSISQQTWAIFHCTTQMTNTSGSPKIQSVIVFYVGGFHHTPKVNIVFPIHTLHLLYHGSCHSFGKKFEQDVSIELLKQERHLDNIDVIKIYVANFNSTP